MKKPFPYNSPEAITEWIYQATENIPNTVHKETLRAEGFRLLRQGNLRGNISEYWVNHHPTFHRYLQNLYL